MACNACPRAAHAVARHSRARWPGGISDGSAARPGALIMQEKTSAPLRPIEMPRSIFARYYASEALVDRFAQVPDGAGAMDVIIPVHNSNEVWEKNLISIYREIPVNRLLIGNGGCTDDSIAIAKQFPRVEVHDHSSFKTLGYSVRELIKAVETEWFAYLHAD